jgi:peptidoglycan/xylan/chitin deacetylase (PgdA/CDA1 family)
LGHIPNAFSDSAARTKKYAVITFDDGLYDFYANAAPILKNNSMEATVFLPAGLMGQQLAGQAVMHWDHARELSEMGITFGSHSMTHPKLAELGSTYLIHEIRTSKEKIESELGQKIDSFSYPYAFPEQDRSFVRSLKKLLTDCGYKYGVTTIIGRSSISDNRFFLKRLPVNDHDDIKFLKAKLEGAYDWLHFVQSISKKTKGLAKKNLSYGD